jgi:hypothetical protein
MKKGKEQMEGTDQLAMRVKIREVLFLKSTILKSNVHVKMTCVQRGGSGVAVWWGDKDRHTHLSLSLS